MPWRSASPEVGASAPVSMPKVVDLPAPLTPRRPKHSPSSMRRQRSRTATFDPNSFRMCRSTTAAAAPPDPAPAAAGDPGNPRGVYCETETSVVEPPPPPPPPQWCNSTASRSARTDASSTEAVENEEDARTSADGAAAGKRVACRLATARETQTTAPSCWSSKVRTAYAAVSAARNESGVPSWSGSYSGGGSMNCEMADRIDSTKKPRPRQYAGKSG